LLKYFGVLVEDDFTLEFGAKGASDKKRQKMNWVVLIGGKGDFASNLGIGWAIS